MRPIIGITVDNKANTAASGVYECGIGYSRAVAAAGGTPVLLPHEAERVGEYVSLCDGFILTGGVDPATEAFGEPTDPRGRPLDPTRQAFELALLEAIDRRPPIPALGVCLGMQLMALHAGGRLDQYLPDTLGPEAAALHEDHHRHPLRRLHDGGALPDADADATVVSRHRQAVADAGRLRVVAVAMDGTIEAIDDPDRPFYLGVQWHPERGESEGPGAPLNWGVIRRLVEACR